MEMRRPLFMIRFGLHLVSRRRHFIAPPQPFDGCVGLWRAPAPWRLAIDCGRSSAAGGLGGALGPPSSAPARWPSAICPPETARCAAHLLRSPHLTSPSFLSPISCAKRFSPLQFDAARTRDAIEIAHLTTRGFHWIQCGTGSAEQMLHLDSGEA